MERHILKTGRHVVPVQIIHSEVEGTPTFTIQHLTTEDVQSDEELSQSEHIIEETVVDHEIIEIHQSQNDSDEPEYTVVIPSSSPSPPPQQSEPSVSQTSPSTTTGAGSKQKSFYCPNCGNCYGAAGSLKLHIRACLRQKEAEAKALEARKCNICGKVYNSISYLKEHILRHSGKAPKKCPKCYRKFVDYGKLEQHLKSHRNESTFDDGSDGEKKVIKEYNCSFCQKKFQVVFDSRYTKRRYACDECREKFTNEENLKQHKESLEEKKEFRCERCGRKFVFEGFLQRHAPACDGTIKRKRDRVF